MSTIVISGSLLTPVVKDLYESGKGLFGTSLSKWNNQKYILALDKKIAAYEKIKTIWQREKEVKLSSFYYPSKITFNTGITKQISSLKELPAIGSLVIQGTVGQGKSVFLRYLCIQELKANSSGRIPIFVELRKLDSTYSLEGAVFSAFQNLGFEISQALFEFYAESGKMVLLLDGFDELEEKIVMQVITKLESWSVAHQKLQLIVTSRPGGEIQKSGHFSVIKLAPLTSNDHEPFLQKIGVEASQLRNILKAIDTSTKEIKDLLTTPLLLTLVVIVYNSENNIPSELPEFFKQLFTTVFSRHDGTKPGFRRSKKSGLNERKLELLFESFCFSMKKKAFKLSISDEQFNEIFADCVKCFDEKFDQDGFKHDIIKVACLLQEDGLYITFIHKSMLDYFSAAFIRSRTDKQSVKIYGSILKHWQPWRATLSYLFYIDKYRYIQNFAIPEVTASLNYLKQFKKTIHHEIENYDMVKEFFGLARASFLEVENGQYKHSLFGPYSSTDFFHWDVLIEKLLPKISTIYATKAEILALYPNAVTNPDNQLEISVNFDDLINTMKNGDTNRIIDKTVQKLNALLVEFNNYIEAEDQKADFLSAFDIANN